MKKNEDLKLLEFENDISLTGMTDDFFAYYLSQNFKLQNKSIVIVCSSLYEANTLYNKLKTYEEDCYLYPTDDYISGKSIAISPDFKIMRLDLMNKLLDDREKIIVCHLDSYLKKIVNKNSYKQSRIRLDKNMILERDLLIKKLNNIGYKREALVEQIGEMAVRGYVLDVFPINQEQAIRIEFFGDELESIRLFDTESQRSLEEIKEVEILPFDDCSQSNSSSISDYLDDKITVFKDYERIKLAYLKLKEDIFSYGDKEDYIFSLEKLLKSPVIYYESLDEDLINSKTKSYRFDVKEAPKFYGNLKKIKIYLKQNLKTKKTINIFLNSRQIKSLTLELNLPFFIKPFEKRVKGGLNFIDQEISGGFIYDDEIFLSQNELFNQGEINPKKYKTKFKYAKSIKSSDNLEIGDYVVHYAHGIGIYNGLSTITKNKLLKDYIEVLFKGNDKLYIPVERIDLIKKYSSKDSPTPKINKLGGTEWEKTKLRARQRAKDIADRLIKLYAKRESSKAFSFSLDTEYQTIFENEFEHEATPDQIKATEEIKRDMEKETPMDRLLCGDVGYGKTEVAFRAIFKATLDSKQSMYLCPTTILAKQQYELALKRFGNFPVNIALLNRFTSTKDTKRILKDFKEGKIDLLIGTHRILSKDVVAADLGFLVVDEEQRFGVLHKEKIKELKENLDVLTLSATPIPRTLQMSLLGIRSLSLIETAPVNRYPVQTYVIEENSRIISECIYKELSRSGQIFILYNKVEDIESKKVMIQNLVPEAKIVIAHGQMGKTDLENRMNEFVEGKHDVLLCTTIIETGIDIPNVNTLIILNADLFGLSQLYQIRGRVGRSDKIGYAYLMYKKDKILNEQAVKRLNAIKKFTELGSGFKIANKDLAIRGAGDILGKEQAGFIDNLGIDLYMEILNNEIDKLKGTTQLVKEEVKEEANLIEVNTHISNEYLSEEKLKIEVHQKINSIDSEESFQLVKGELEDRFGKLDEDTKIYMAQKYFENLARKLNVLSSKETNSSVELSFDKNTFTNRNNLLEEVYLINSNFTIKEKRNKIVLTLYKNKLSKHHVYYLLDLFKSLTGEESLT